jgi:hypothetical protein
MDCFVASAPRNDVDGASTYKTVVPREGGGSSTPRLLGSIISVSGILDRPPSRTMTTERVKRSFAISRHDAPEVCQKFPCPLDSQRAQGMPDARCTRGLMRNVHRKCAHEHTGQRRTSDIPCAMALRLITSSPRRTALLPPLRPEKQLPPGALTPAPRRQDHTSLPYASATIAS